MMHFTTKIKEAIVNCILLCLIVLVFEGFLVSALVKFAEAAEVAIDTSIDTGLTSHNGSSPTVVFISDQEGYAFYRDSSGSCVYSKTTNGGDAWGVAVSVDVQTDCLKVGVWYDRWTPGDTTGTYIYVVTMDGADLWYTRLDTSGDTLSTTVNASAANQAGGFAVGANIPSITKGTDGDLYMGVQDPADSFVIKCVSGADCTQASNWTEAGTNPFDLATDWLILMPLASGNILAIRWDLSADDVQSKVYNDAGNSWDGSWTTVDANAIEDGGYDAHFGATLRKSTGDVYLVYVADVATFGTNDDIRSAVYSSGAWTGKTDVLTDDAKGLTGAKMSFDENTNEIYAVYTARTTPGTASTGNVYWKKSDDEMTSWGTEQGPVNTTPGDIYGARVNIVSTGRIYATWDPASANDLLGNTIAVSNPVPTTTNISPDTKAAFDSTFTLTVNGTNFLTNSTVQFNGSSRTTAFINANQLTAEILSSDLTEVGTFNITVVNPTPGGGTSNAQILTVQNPVPTISNISPDTKVAGSAEFTLTVNGSSFVSGSVVKFAGSDRVTLFINSDQLTATILASDIAIDGDFLITVFNPTPGGGTSNTSTFSVSPTPPPPDITPPSAITDLVLSDETELSIRLTWTAPGDDGDVGAASTYDIRYSTSLIDDGNWDIATLFDNEPSPAVAGTSQNITVFGLSSGTTYYFAMKTSDGVPNTSAISNVPSLATVSTPDTTAPDVVSDLALGSPSDTSMTVSWTAPGDDGSTGTATSYDLRYSTSVITSGNFDLATVVAGEPTPGAAGALESMTVSGLLADVIHFFAIKSSDEVPNISALSNVPSLATLAGSNGGGGGGGSSSGSVRKPKIISLINAPRASALPAVSITGLPDTGSVEKSITRAEARTTFYRLLRVGTRGADVVALQKALKQVGTLPGAVDGAFGPITRAAVVQYQASVGLVPDGIFGPLTTAKLIYDLEE